MAKRPRTDDPSLLSPDDKDEEIARLRAELSLAHAHAAKWAAAFGDSKSADAAADEHKALRTSFSDNETQLNDIKKRERALVMRLSGKEEQISQSQTQIVELTNLCTIPALQLNSTILDPSVAREFTRLREEVKSCREELVKCQNDAQAIKFTQESLTGKRLMSKCKTLQEENEDFATQVSEGRVKKLEMEISLKAQHIAQLKKGLTESQGYISMLDEEMENMQNSIFFLHQELEEQGN